MEFILSFKCILIWLFESKQKLNFAWPRFQEPASPRLHSHQRGGCSGMRIAYLRCICVFIIYMHCQRAQVGTGHLSCTWLTRGGSTLAPFAPLLPISLAVHSVVAGDCFMRSHRHTHTYTPHRSGIALLHI